MLPRLARYRLTGVGADLELEIARRNGGNRQLRRTCRADIAGLERFLQQDAVAVSVGYFQPAVGCGTSSGEGGDDTRDRAVDQSGRDDGDSGVGSLDQCGRPRFLSAGRGLSLSLIWKLEP